MAATRLYFMDTTANVSGYVSSEKSTALPVGTFNDSGRSPRDLSLTKSGTIGLASLTTLAQTADQDGYHGKWISPVVLSGGIDANTWSIGYFGSEGNNASNAFLCLSVYILTSGDTVRNFIYDSHTSLGVEYNGAGQVVTFSGSAVSGVANTDRLVVELWSHAGQSMANSYLNELAYSGTGSDMAPGSGFGDAAWVETPQDIFTAPAAPAGPVSTPYSSLGWLG